MPSSMQKSKILVVGQGFLGMQIADYFASHAHVSTIDFPDVDITSEESLASAFTRFAPDIVINAAAFADTHAAEKPENHAKVFDINVRGPVNLMMLARRFNYDLVHIGTGMIYDGKSPQRTGFSETDTPNPTSYYAWTKACADACLASLSTPSNILITRIHLPIASKPNLKNLLTKMITFDTFATDASSITVVDDYLNSLKNLLEQKAVGVFHMVNPGTISFYEIAEALQKHGLIPQEKRLNKTTLEELNQKILEKGGAKQTSTVLDIQKLGKHGTVGHDAKLALEQCIKQYKLEIAKPL